MTQIHYAMLAPLARSLLAPVRSRPGPVPGAKATFQDARELIASEVETDDAPPTVRCAA